MLVEILEQVPIFISTSQIFPCKTYQQNKICLPTSIFQLPIYSPNIYTSKRYQVNSQKNKRSQESKSQTIVTGPPLYLGRILSEQMPSSVAFLLLPLILFVTLLIVLPDLFWFRSWFVDFFNICGLSRLTSESWTGFRKNSSAPSSMHL